jgi:hypothetical protein
LGCSLYLERSWSLDAKMVSHESFGHLQPKLWTKEGPGVKLPVSLLTTKSQESTFFWRLQKECNMALKSSPGELQLWFRPCSNRMLQSGDMSSQSPGTPTREVSGPGGRWWLPLSSGCGESSVSKCMWLVSTPKGVPECELTLLWLVLDADSSEIILVPLPNLISGLLACPSTPF